MQLVVIKCCVIQAERLHCFNACSLSLWVKMIQMIKFLINDQPIVLGVFQNKNSIGLNRLHPPHLVKDEET